MAGNTLESIILYVDQNSQSEQSSSNEQGKGRSGTKELKKYYEELDKYEKSAADKYRQRRLDVLREQYDSEEELQKAIEKDIAEIQEYEEQKKAKNRKEQLREQIEYGATLQERKDAERQLKQQEMVDAFVDKIGGTIDTLFTTIKNSGKEYAEYVEKIEVGLIGSTKDYDSVTSKLDKVFSMNVFFSMEEALKKTTEMIESGIAYNVELRSSLDLMSEKIAKTFDAMDATLTRLVKIQQQDSTQARLGMESLLLNYLNSTFENSQYLHGLSDQVSALLLEASSQKGRNESVEFEYAVQKWLGSMSSVGVSDAAILALAEGLGYLGSGNVSALTSNSSLQQLMAISATKGGGNKSYGEMLTGGIGVEDVSSILLGFWNLVNEIENSGNMVAMNQYASLFGLSMSDIKSVLNLTAEDLSAIASQMVSYEQTIKQVTDELSVGKLFKRSSYSEMMTNLEKNILTSIGLDMADSIVGNVAYTVAELAAGIVESMDLGTEIHPWGVGASIDLDLATMIKAGMVTGTYLSAIIGNISAITSALSPNLKLLGGEESASIKILGGAGINLNSPGQTTNQSTYVGRTDSGTVMSTVKQQSDSQTSSIMEKDVDEESKKMERLSKAMLEIADNVEFIVQLLNVNGIKVRYYPGNGVSSPASWVPDSGASSTNSSGNETFFSSGGK